MFVNGCSEAGLGRSEDDPVQLNAVRPEIDSQQCEGAVSNNDEEMDVGGRMPVRVKNPARPSEAEVAEHSLTHLPFRDWCPHCV